MYGSEVRTVLDLGGQTMKAVHLHAWNRIQDVMISDKCATGFGRAVELMADVLRVPITDMGSRSLLVEKDPEPVSTTCYAFAIPETVSMLRPEYKGEDYDANGIMAAFLFSLSWRALGLVGKLQPLDAGPVGVYKELAITGGAAKNPGIVKRIERELNVSVLRSEYDPMLAGALGAALIAAEPESTLRSLLV